MSNSNLNDIKKLAGKLFLFFLPIVVIAYPLDKYLVKKQKENTGEEVHIWKDLYEGQINPDVAIYGSSRAGEMIDPIMISDSLHTNAYNLGINGHNFYLEYLRHRLLFRYNKKPKVIIVSFDLTFLAKRPDLYEDDQFLPFMLWDNELAKYLGSYEGYIWPDYYVPLLRYYNKGPVIAAFLSRKSNPRPRGYHPQYYIDYNNDGYDHKQTIKFYAGVIKLFGDFLAECKQRNIKVIMVYSPEYVGDRDLVLNRSQMLNYFINYSKKYNVPYFDFSNDSLSYQKKYFWNMEHLNVKGAEIFTRELIDTLNKTHVLGNVLSPNSPAK